MARGPPYEQGSSYFCTSWSSKQRGKSSECQSRLRKWELGWNDSTGRWLVHARRSPVGRPYRIRSVHLSAFHKSPFKVPDFLLFRTPQHCEAHNVLMGSAQTTLDGPQDEDQGRGPGSESHSSQPLTEAQLTAPLRDESQDSTTTVHRGKTKLLHRLRIRRPSCSHSRCSKPPGSSRNRIYLPLSSAGC